MSIYDMEGMAASERALLDRARPIKARDRIKEFLEEYVQLRNLSGHRYYYYGVRLRKTLEILKNQFLDPNEADLRTYLKALMGKVNDRTVIDYIDAYKRFQAWNNKGKLPDKFTTLNFKAKKNGKAPEDLKTPDEFQKMIDNAGSTRNKALIATLYDSSCSLGEILGMKRKDVEFDQFGTTLSVFGKTRFRKTYIVGSIVMFLKLLLKENSPTDPNAYIFTKVKGNGREDITYADCRKMLSQTLGRADVTKRIPPHLFRHTRASIFASQITEAPSESQMGWVHGSRQTQTYVHLSGEQQKRAVLKAYGLILENENLDTGMRRCPSCGNQIGVKSEFCPFCLANFTKEKNQTLSQARESLLNEIQSLRILAGQTVTIKKDTLINSIPGEVEMTFDKSALDLIVNEVLKKLKSEETKV